jgi:hypothetical protein
VGRRGRSPAHRRPPGRCIGAGPVGAAPPDGTGPHRAVAVLGVATSHVTDRARALLARAARARSLGDDHADRYVRSRPRVDRTNPPRVRTRRNDLVDLDRVDVADDSHRPHPRWHPSRTNTAPALVQVWPSHLSQPPRNGWVHSAIDTWRVTGIDEGKQFPGCGSRGRRRGTTGFGGGRRAPASGAVGLRGCRRRGGLTAALDDPGTDLQAVLVERVVPLPHGGDQHPEGVSIPRLRVSVRFLQDRSFAEPQGRSTSRGHVPSQWAFPVRCP